MSKKKSNSENQDNILISNQETEVKKNEPSATIEPQLKQLQIDEVPNLEEGQSVKKSLFKFNFREVNPLVLALIGAVAAILVGLITVTPSIYQLIFPPQVRCGELQQISEKILESLDLISKNKEIIISESKDAKYKELIDYYKEANPNLVGYLNSFDNIGASSKDQSFKLAYIGSVCLLGRTKIDCKMAE